MMLFPLSSLHAHPKVMVYLMESPDVCSSASNRREHSQRVKVAAESTRSVPFIIIPMKHGTYPIVVKASVAVRQITDGIQRDLIVVVSKRGDGVIVFITLYSLAFLCWWPHMHWIKLQFYVNSSRHFIYFNVFEQYVTKFNYMFWIACWNKDHSPSEWKPESEQQP